jgi:hypothetical protein
MGATDADGTTADGDQTGSDACVDGAPEPESELDVELDGEGAGGVDLHPTTAIGNATGTTTTAARTSRAMRDIPTTWCVERGAGSSASSAREAAW